jgi:hypothetical protein
MRDHGHKPENGAASSRDVPVRRSPEQPYAGAQAARAQAPLTPGMALALQRAIGNRAVARLLQQQRHTHDAACGHPADASGPVTPATVQRSTVPDVLRSPGQPLAGPLRAEMEARLGADFADVRVHDDAAAARSAAEIGARAYTSGHHVVIGPGGGGRHTLAHELTHVIQQRQGQVAGTETDAGLRMSDPGDWFERAAEANATEVMRRPLPGGEAARTRRSSGSVQRAVAGVGPHAPIYRSVVATPTPAADLEGECGYFARERQLSVNPIRAGLIVQEVTRQFNVEEYDAASGAWTAMSNARIDTYATRGASAPYATDTHYWELWEVDALGSVSDTGIDTFGLTAIVPVGLGMRNRIDTTRGNFTMTGNAMFYEVAVPAPAVAATPAVLNFVRGSVVCAGGLFSTAADPAAAIAAAVAGGQLVAAGPAVQYSVTATWNSARGSDRYTVIT